MRDVKYLKAMEIVKIGRICLFSKERQRVYKQLNDNFFFWNPQKQEWKLADNFDFVERA